MDLAKESKPSFQFDKRLVSLAVNLPGIWLIYHLFIFGLNLNNKDFGFEFINRAYRTGQLIEEYQKYRNSIYFFYVFLMVGVAFLIMVGKRRTKVGIGKEDSGQESWISYVVPASIQAIILVTFSYTIAGFLLDFYVFIKNTI